MSEFFLELFTEEMPPSLQNNTKVEFLDQDPDLVEFCSLPAGGNTRHLGSYEGQI